MPETIDGKIESTGNEQRCRLEALGWCGSWFVLKSKCQPFERVPSCVCPSTGCKQRGESLRPAAGAGGAAAAPPLVRLLRNDELRQGTTPPKQMTMGEQGNLCKSEIATQKRSSRGHSCGSHANSTNQYQIKTMMKETFSNQKKKKKVGWG